MTANDRQGERLEQIYLAWDEALSHNQMDELLGLYAPNATLESPVIPHLMGVERGVCVGHDEIRPVLQAVFDRKPPIRQYYRTGYFTDGHTIMFEYPRHTPDGEQMDFVEIMEIEDGLIQHHRVYWGWLGVKVLADDGYHSLDA